MSCVVLRSGGREGDLSKDLSGSPLPSGSFLGGTTNAALHVGSFKNVSRWLETMKGGICSGSDDRNVPNPNGVCTGIPQKNQEESF